MTLTLDAPALQRSRLAACLALSAVLHLGIVAALPRPAPGAPTPAMLVLLLRDAHVGPEVPATTAPPPQHLGFAAARPQVRHKPALGRRATPIPPVRTAAPAATREPLPDVQQAYNDLTAAQEAERLSESQRRVPRGNSLSRCPQEIEPIRPLYPPDELKRGERALVLLEAFVSAGGAVEDVVVLDDEGKPAFAAAATQAVRSAAFRPAQDTRGPVPSRVTLAVRFTFE